MPDHYAKTSLKDADEKTHIISLEHVEKAIGGKLFENTGETGNLKKGYSEKQDNNEKNILKKEYANKKEKDFFQEKGGRNHQTSWKI